MASSRSDPPASCAGATVTGETCQRALRESGDRKSAPGSRFIVETAKSLEVVVAVIASASIAGHVVDGAGKAIAGATSDRERRTRSERRGDDRQRHDHEWRAGAGRRHRCVELTGLAAGTYKLGALDAGRPLPPSGKPVEVTVAASEHKAGVVVTADRANGVIEGVVTSADGKPIADAWVSVHQELEDMIAGLLGAQGEGGSDHGSRSVTIVSNSDGGGGIGDVAPALTDASGHFKLVGLRARFVDGDRRGASRRVARSPARGHARRAGHDPSVQRHRAPRYRARIERARDAVYGDVERPDSRAAELRESRWLVLVSARRPGDYTVHVESDLGNGDAG